MPAETPSALIEVRNLTYEYRSHSVFNGSPPSIAVNQVTTRIKENSVTGLAGASGSGKSTLARCLAGLEAPTSGTVLYRGQDLSLLSSAQRLQHRRRVQLVWQDPALMLNPRFTAARAVAEPLVILKTGSRAEQRKSAIYWIERVGLPPDSADRPALEFSGGERYRIAIARSLTLNPELMIFDESFSAMDAPVRRRILDLLMDLRSRYRLTYIFISHDLGLLAQWCHEVIVMYQGRIVETAPVETLLTAPIHLHATELVNAIPRFPAGWLVR